MIHKQRLPLFLIPTLMLPLLGVADDKRQAPEEPIVLRRCLLEYRHVSELGSPVNGVLQECKVELGDTVKEGQLLGRIQDIEQRAEMNLRKAEAESDILIKVAEAKSRFAATKLATGERLLGQNSTTKLDVEELRTSAEVARLEIEEAKFRRRLADLLHKKAESAVVVREITAPHDGVVTQIYKQRGSAIQTSQDPVFRVVNTDVLRAVGFLDVADAWRVRPGQEVELVPHLSGQDQAPRGEIFRGKVVFVDTEIEPKTQTCRIVAEVRNRDNLLKSGLEARMEIKPRKATVRAGQSHYPTSIKAPEAAPDTPHSIPLADASFQFLPSWFGPAAGGL